jgi:isopentenyl-diphosphate delta-isomerase
MEAVILVDEQDNAIGEMEKLEAHRKGVLHRAFSILLFNDAGDILLQRRSLEKYHSGGLWSNTCCSHPLPEEDILQAAKRKLQQEMGIEAALEFAYKFIYKVDLGKGLMEYEMDHVLIGTYNGAPNINEEEVSEWKYSSMESLRSDIALQPHAYTHWFKLIVEHPALYASLAQL